MKKVKKVGDKPLKWYKVDTTANARDEYYMSWGNTTLEGGICIRLGGVAPVVALLREAGYKPIA